MSAPQVRVNTHDIRAALNGNQKAKDRLLTACERSERDKVLREQQRRQTTIQRPKKRAWKPDPPELVEGKRLVRERSGGWCEAKITEVCDGRSVHVHHVAGRVGKRAHDPSNLLDLCSDCHSWIHANPDAAMGLGFLRSRLAVRPVGSEGEG